MTAEPAPSRGDATREALVRSAVTVFGRDGFDAASTRALAETAGVNQALIAYHFGGKAGLYLAAIEFIGSRMRERLGPRLEAIGAELEQGNGAAPPRRCLQLLLDLLDAFVVVLASDESQAWAKVVLREQQEPTEGFERLYRDVMSRLLGMLSRLIGSIRGLDPELEEVRLLAFTLVGQALVFRAGRATVERRMGWSGIGEREIAAVQRQIHRNVTAIFRQEGEE